MTGSAGRPAFGLRAAGAGDYDFCFALHRELKPYVEATWGWDEEFQRKLFHERFDAAKLKIITFEGRDVGELGVEDGAEGIFLERIVVAREFQGRGIGASVVRGVLEEARRRGVPVTLRVLKANPARRLYERLGFVVTHEDRERFYMKAALPPAALRDLVRQGYDRVAEAYRQAYGREAEYAGWVERLTARLAPGGEVLDLGCGCGVPAARALASAGFRVLGVDHSAAQIRLATGAVPEARFECGDMTEVGFEAGRFGAVVCLYALIHLPLEEQKPLLERISVWLKPGGLLLATVGHGAWTGVEEDWLGVKGARMYWSHGDGALYRGWLRESGFDLVWEEFVPERAGGHDLILAEKRI